MINIPWTISVILDEGREDIGLLTAIYTENDKEIFSFSLRSEVSIKAQEKFLELAKTKLAERTSKQLKEAALSSSMTITANKILAERV